MTNAFSILHSELVDLYFGLCDGVGQPDVPDLKARLSRLRDVVKQRECPDSLVAYERYLGLIAMRLHQPGLKEALTLLDDGEFHRILKRDPSRPYALLGAGMARRRMGDDRRARQLLRRLAASQFPERKLAQRLLAASVQKEDRA